jgi:hypothetical protein
MILVKRMSPMIMPVRAAAVLHRYLDITLDSGLDPIIAEHRAFTPSVHAHAERTQIGEPELPRLSLFKLDSFVYSYW